MNTPIVIFGFEIIGTIAFALSGVLVATEKEMDLLGVVIMGLTVAVGGGIIRDVLLGQTPPIAFKNPIYITVGGITALIAFFPSIRRWAIARPPLNDWAFQIMDAIGLGVFAATGVRAGFATVGSDQIVLLLFLGVVTGAGGGVMRDVFAGKPPSIFVENFYATAALIGAASCIILWHLIGEEGAMLLCLVIVVSLRILAIHFNWELPKSRI